MRLLTNARKELRETNMDESRPPTLGSVLRAAREQHGLDRRQLARLVEVAPSQITRWEADAKVPLSKSLVALARQLELRASELFELAGKPIPPDLANLPAMLRAEYDLPAEAIAEIQKHIQAVAKQYRAARPGR
jgi:transcriptional regulator with XRE-family HTH domain